MSGLGNLTSLTVVIKVPRVSIARRPKILPEMATDGQLAPSDGNQ